MSGQIEQYLEQEISELKAQIAAMTKDMDSMKPWRELQRENAMQKEMLALMEDQRLNLCEDIDALKRENEELRKENNRYFFMANDESFKTLKLEEQLAAHKAQSTEQPVAWIIAGKDGVETLARYESTMLQYEEWGYEITPLITQDQATALVADFKRRAIEVCMNKAKVVTQLNYAGGCEWCAEAIESLPLIGEKE